jgi:hypothetical protein
MMSNSAHQRIQPNETSIVAHSKAMRSERRWALYVYTNHIDMAHCSLTLRNLKSTHKQLNSLLESLNKFRCIAQQFQQIAVFTAQCMI